MRHDLTKATYISWVQFQKNAIESGSITAPTYPDGVVQIGRAHV